MPVVMIAPDHHAIFFQQATLGFVDRIRRQPVGFIQVVVERGLMRDDEIHAEPNGAQDYFVRSQKGRRHTADLLGRVTHLYGVHGRRRRYIRCNFHAEVNYILYTACAWLGPRGYRRTSSRGQEFAACGHEFGFFFAERASPVEPISAPNGLMWCIEINNGAMIRTLLTAGLIVIAATPLQAAAQDNGWVDLVQGNTLEGWTRLNGEATYKVREGMIIGVTTPNTPNTFLATNETYQDFALKVEVWVAEGINSGIQIRSESRPDYMNGRVHGYQVEIDPSARAWSGGLYDEARRGWLYPLTLNPACRKAFKVENWNEYYVEAIGPSMRTWVNGVPCAALYDDLTPEGFIALQVHSIGSEAQAGKEVRWRNIQLRPGSAHMRPLDDTYVVNLVPNTLSPQEKAQGWELIFDGISTTGWRGAGKEQFPARGWQVRDGVLIVEASGGAEATYGGDIVTVDEYDMFEVSLDFRLTEGANSGIKYFITESYGSDASAIGLEFQLLDDKRHPDATQGAAGNRTLGSLYDLIPAATGKLDRGPGRWNRARIVVKDQRLDETLQGNRMEQHLFKGAYVEHWLNDRMVVAYERGTPSFDALVARSKYVVWEGFGHWQSGHILLQDHGDEVHFRSIKVRRLASDQTLGS